MDNLDNLKLIIKVLKSFKHLHLQEQIYFQQYIKDIHITNYELKDYQYRQYEKTY